MTMREAAGIFVVVLSRSSNADFGVLQAENQHDKLKVVMFVEVDREPIMKEYVMSKRGKHVVEKRVRHARGLECKGCIPPTGNRRG